ncbi:Biosynthetic peptidoglycan transglycosylase [Alphaproteobacteria bacterium SO-S41]|nr:Biosynthetic peptidoglycan transglycosylase [Alphaproteobacteria bacterium SO-S41]
MKSSQHGTLRGEAPWRKGAPPPAARRKPRAGGGKNPKRRKKSRGWGIFKFVFATATLGAMCLAMLVAYYASGLPPTDQLFGVKGTPSITVLDIDGKVIATRGAGVGSIVPVGEMSPYLPKAVMAIEDRRFYDHFGLDLWGTTRALFANFEAGRVVQGGSTITQQLAKNLFLTPERTFERKMEEALLAIWLEMKYSKDEILTLYLNRVYFGAGTYGVEAASRRYFNKSARDLTLKEAAILAGLLKAPSRLAPTKDAEAAEDRAQVVLNSMVEAGFISEADRKDADKARPNVMVTRSSPGADYFADWVLEQVPGFIGGPPEGDIVVETTLDLSMQQAAETAVSDALAAKGDKLKIGQGAFVAMTTDGAIKAMVGGRSYAESQFNRAVQAQRPPGSAFKPFVFLAALEAGYTPESIVLDAPISLKKWNPGNYKHKYEGEVTLTRALSRSLNSVAIRLIVSVGPKEAAAVAKRLGVLSPLMAQPALALGTSEVNLLELTSAYAPFANGGMTAMPHGIVKIRSREGRTLYERQGSGPMEAVAPVFAAEMTYMMRETVLAGTAKRARLADRDAAGKTGTGQSFRDAWFVGYTRDMVAGVWVGNDDNAAMKDVTGGSVPAEIWAAFMGAVAERTEAGPLIALENAPSTAVAAGAGWTEAPGPEDGVSEDVPPEGGYAALEDPAVPDDNAPMDVPLTTDQAEFDKMFNDMFGEDGEIAREGAEPRPAARPAAYAPR